MKINLDYPGKLFDPPELPRKLIQKTAGAIILVSACAYLIYPWLHEWIGLPTRLEIALTGAVASIQVLFGAIYMLRKHLSIAFTALSVHNQCSVQAKCIRESYMKTVTDIEQYNAVLRSQLREAIAQTETAVFQVVSRMMVIHEKSDSQMARIGSSAEKSVELMHVTQEQIRTNQVVLESLNDLSAKQIENLEDHLRRIQDLSLKIEQFRPLVAMISEIAERTNLLALNAAIEAAHAGAAGKGFAVIASEVRQLCIQTNESAREISEKISEIADHARKETENAMNSIATQKDSLEFKKLADNITSIAERFGNASSFLEDITLNIDEANKIIVHQISTALGEIQFQDVVRQRVEHVSTGLDRLSDYAQGTVLWLQGQSDNSPERLNLQLDELQAGYVMEEQRITHDAVIGSGSSGRAATGPRVEHF